MSTPARAANAAAVLRTVLLHGPVPRSRLAELSDLSPATVTRLYPPLAERRLLRELEGPEVGQTLGRPRVPVDLDASGWVALGVHLGVRRSVFGAIDLRGRLLGAGEVEHEDGAGPESVIGQACERLRALHARVAGRRRVLGLGVITDGRVDAEAGRLSEQPGLGWPQVDLRAEFARRIDLARPGGGNGNGNGFGSGGGHGFGGIPNSQAPGLIPAALAPATPVFVDEHVRAMATAESLFGRARQARSLGYLCVGNVIGFAHSADGAVHRGSRAAAGDIEHLPLGVTPPADGAVCTCGSRDCFLALAGERGVAERAVELGVVPEPRIELVLKAARAGDEVAVRLLRDRAGNVGAAVAVLLGILDPELFVVAGRGLTEAAEYLSDLRAGTRERLRGALPGALPVPIVPTAFGAQVDAVAAASVVIDRVVRDPLAVRVPR
jgi:predicted NBD/HSP70 family sugar kinase